MKKGLAISIKLLYWWAQKEPPTALPIENTQEWQHTVERFVESPQMTVLTAVVCCVPLHAGWSQLSLREMAVPPGGGGLEYLHRSPASCKRRRKGTQCPGV
jgi:hypothetical protein